MNLPKFLQFPIYALDISDETFKYLKLEEKNTGTTAPDFGEGNIPKGIVEKGDIRDENALIEILRPIFSKKGIKYAAVSLPEDKGYFRTIDLEGVKEGEIRGAIELQLEEYVPLPPGEVTFDFDLVEKKKNSFSVFLRAFPKHIVETYLGVVSRAGALPVFVESEIYSLARSVIPYSFTEPVLVADWGKTKISFSIAENDRLHFVTTVSLGGNDLDSAVAKSLKVDIKRAEALKIEKGFVPEGESMPVFQALVPVVSAVMDELEKYKNYYETHSKSGIKIKNVIFAGGVVTIPGLKEHFTRELGLKIILADPWTNVRFPKYYLPDIVYRESVRFATAIGLALGAAGDIKYL